MIFLIIIPILIIIAQNLAIDPEKTMLLHLSKISMGVHAYNLLYLKNTRSLKKHLPANIRA